MKIKDWYLTTYESDSMGLEINSDITFADLFHVLDRGQNVYDFLGVEDSTIRERAFVKLANIIEADYEYVYDQWLLGS